MGSASLAALARHQHDDALDIEFGFAHRVRSPNLYERYTWSTWPMAATMNNFVGDGNGHVSEVRNEIETSGYALTHLRASYSWKQARLDFGVENLFDRLYSLPTGGAYLGQGSTMQVNGVPWGIAVPGMGRTFYVGMTLGF